MTNACIAPPSVVWSVPRRQSPPGLSLFLASFVSILIATLFALLSNELMHWFLIPVTMCGIVIGCDAADWLRGRLALFDAAGLLGLLGYHFFFLAPLLLVLWHHRMLYLPDQPEDYRAWLGGMGVLNFAGLLVYREVRWRVGRVATPTKSAAWTLEPKRFWILLIVGLIASGALQIWVYASLGGIKGYVDAYTSWLSGQEDSFKASTLLFSASESFPILAILGFAAWSRRAASRSSWLMLGCALGVFFMLELLFGGLRGSRSNILWGLVWAVGILHFSVRRMPGSLVLCGVPFLVVFVSVYAVYKQHGAQAFELFQKSEAYSEIGNEAEGPATVLVGDFSRGDVQAFLLYRMFNGSETFDLAWGQTYLGALSLLIPKSVWENRPPTKAKWTTEAEYGHGAYDAGPIQSSRVYGLAGEAMLNVGPYCVPLAFTILGFAVGRVQRAVRSLTTNDSRLLLMPFFTNFCFLVLLNDSDNAVFYLLKYGMVPILFIVFSSRRTPCAVASSRPA
jgi:hypothetical protein